MPRAGRDATTLAHYARNYDDSRRKTHVHPEGQVFAYGYL